MKLLILEYSFLFFMMLFIPAAAYIDTTILENRLSEISVTEISQSTAVLIATILFYKVSHSQPAMRFYLLVTTLLAMIFIREADYYFDFVYHGFWKVPVFLVFCSCAYQVYQKKSPL